MLTPQVTTKRHAGRKVPVAVSVPAGDAQGRLVSESAPATPGAALDPDTRRRMIAEAAYFRAEQRGFAPGGELQDWLAAEADIGTRVGS